MTDLQAPPKKQNIRPVYAAVYRPFYVVPMLVLFCVLLSSPAHAQAQPHAAAPRRILVVCSYGYGLHGYDKVIPAIRSVFESSGFNTSDFYVEFMDLLRSKDKDAKDHLADFLTQKYSTTKFDLIVTIQLAALLFFLEEGKELWPDAPILAVAIPDPAAPDNTAGRRVVIQSLSPDIKGTLNIALELFPGTKRVMYVTGTTTEEKRAQRVAESAFSQWRDRLEFQSTSDLTIDETVQLLSKLPGDTIVIFVALHVDKAGRAIMPKDIVTLLSRAASVPIFATYDTALGAGAIGGSMVNVQTEGTRLGQLAVDILKGDLVPSYQMTVLTTSRMPMFDWQQLERWRVDKSKLPKGSTIVNRPYSVWDSHRWNIISILVILLVQSLLIMGLLIHRRRRKSAEESLKKAEEKYRHIFEGALEGIYETSPEGKSMTANPALARLLGFDSPDETLSSITDTGNQVWVDPNERRNFIQLLEQHDVILNYECQFYRKDRSIIWVALSARRVLGPDGRTLYYSGFVTDISERKRIEEALAESRAQVRGIIDSTNDLIWSVDPVNFGVVTWNRALEDYFRNSRGIELRAGMTPEQLVPPDYVPVWIEFYQRCLREGSFVSEYTVASKTIVLLLSMSLLERNGEVFGIAVFGKDITKRKLIEDELRISKDRYRALVETSSDWLWEVDGNAKYTYAAPRVQEILGYAPGELLGRTAFELMPEVEARRVKSIFAGIVATRRPFSSLTNTNLHRNGRLVILESSGVPIFDRDGEFLGYRGMDRDVTDRVMAEQELRKHREHLEELIEERTAELIVAKEQAEAADRVKSVFLATMSHELRTPLNSIIGFTELLEQERTGPLNKEQKQQLGVVRESGSHLLNLINDILDISKIEAGQLKVSRESFDLRSLIERTTRATKPLTEEKSIEFEVEIADDVNSISSDRRRVEQILLNLLSNAIKFTDEGKIHVSCSLQGREVWVSVRDTGIGIRSQDVERLFKPFQQIQTGRHFEGTGLGLSICKKLLDLLGGRIEVHSEWGKGSTFSFALPIEKSKE